MAYVEQAWELTYALEKRVELPAVDLPGFTGGGDVDPGAESLGTRRRRRGRCGSDGGWARGR